MFVLNVCGLQLRDAALGILASLQNLDLLSLEMQPCPDGWDSRVLASIQTRASKVCFLTNSQHSAALNFNGVLVFELSACGTQCQISWNSVTQLKVLQEGTRLRRPTGSGDDRTKSPDMWLSYWPSLPHSIKPQVPASLFPIFGTC